MGNGCYQKLKMGNGNMGNRTLPMDQKMGNGIPLPVFYMARHFLQI